MTSFSKPKSFLDIFPTPEFLLLSTVGIVISDADIKLIQVRRQMFGYGFKIVHLEKSANPKGAIENGVIQKPDELKNILKKFSSDYGIGYAHAILPEEKAYLFTATIERVPAEALRDAVAFIIEGNAPVTLAESVFDFEIIEDDGHSNKLKISVTVLPESVVNSYIDLFKSASITPVSFHLESQALSRAVINKEDKAPHLIVNLAFEKTGFYVVDKGVVQFSTTLPHGVSEDETHSNINDLKSEMHKVFAFWDSRSNKKIEKAILCGPQSSNDDLISDLTSGNSTEYILVNAWSNIPLNHRGLSNVTLDQGLDYLSAIGLVVPR